MSSSPRSRRSWALAVLAVAALASCRSEPTGVAAQAEDPGFRECLVAAGEPSLGEDLSVAEEREWLAQPEVLTCVADELDAEGRTDVLARAFPSDADPDDEDWADHREAKRTALVDYVQSQPTSADEARVITRVAALMQGFGWDGAFWHTPRQQVAFAHVRAREGAAEYDAWREEHPLPDEPATWADYLEAEPSSGLATRTDEVASAIERAQDDL